MKNTQIIFSIFFLTAAMFPSLSGAEAATYYVRTDGGTSTQCTGLADAAYPGSGTNQACALSHPYWVLSVAGSPNKMVGGDTLIIGPGEYQMGLGAPNTPSCSQFYPWDCYMRAVPSGTAAHPTRILGKGWDSGCTAKPQLWGTERSASVMNLQGSSHVELQCLEITDHSSCMDSGPDLATRCNRDVYPYGPWALVGIVAADSQDVLVKNVNIHGLRSGIMAGRLSEWTLEDTDIIANSFVGWDGDIGASTSSNSGHILFKNSRIMWNGCGQTYPGLEPHHCYSQDQGGYGDGLGTNKTGGDWVFDHVDFSYNVSDGLDLLYHNGNGSITISHSRFEGNAGNQVKVAADTQIDNSKLIGDCAFFNGKTFTSTTGVGLGAVAFNNCRAAGSTLAIAFKPGMRAEIYNSTVTGNGDVMVISSGTNCLSTDKVVSKNNIYVGGIEFNDGADLSDLYYASGQYGNGEGTCGAVPFATSNDIIWGTKYNSIECSATTSKCVDPQLTGPLSFTGADQNVALQSTSPAINGGVVIGGIPTTDYNNYERGSQWDIGALEYGSVTTTAGASSSPTVPNESVATPPASSSAAGSSTTSATGSENSSTPTSSVTTSEDSSTSSSSSAGGGSSTGGSASTGSSGGGSSGMTTGDISDFGGNFGSNDDEDHESESSVQAASEPANGYIGPSQGTGTGTKILKLSARNSGKVRKTTVQGKHGYTKGTSFKKPVVGLTKSKRSGWWTK